MRGAAGLVEQLGSGPMKVRNSLAQLSNQSGFIVVAWVD
jgi:hypothetical protein